VTLTPRVNTKFVPRRARWSSKTGQWPSRGAQIAERARWKLSKITGSEAENVTALERSGDGTWKITVELLEQPGTPETLDLIGSYETELDEEGKLLGYRRLRHYPRNRRGPEDSLDAEQ
jgi:Gas vesicle synthesis protein GvpO